MNSLTAFSYELAGLLIYLLELQFSLRVLYAISSPGGNNEERNWICLLGFWESVVAGLGSCFSFWHCFYNYPMMFSRPVHCICMDTLLKFAAVLSKAECNIGNFLQAQIIVPRCSVSQTYLALLCSDSQSFPSEVNETIGKPLGLGWYVVL